VVLFDTPALTTLILAMRYRVELLIRADADEEAVHEILMRANTYAIIETVEATRHSGGEDYLFTATIDAPSPEAALGAVLTVLAQTSGYVGLVEEGSVRRVVIEREG
jgi:hypothetical protein